MRILIIAGSRSFTDFDFMTKVLDEYVANNGLLELVVMSGAARGADRLGERWAEMRGYPVILMPANWKLHPKAAGYRRNEAMAQAATDCLVFWDGVSPGSLHMFKTARKHRLRCDLIRVKPASSSL